ncbi:platelet-derived growth factor receptor beta [Hypanus sabinus]|uniref:platelet-derived growth factor receptor beta n=1 Tax=Hypanus sabinus TaxID=79690 RepID=UPI0028C4F4C2|nr:platelet-derived growth factor receptor beta [Hypanus sabinus]
MSTVRWDLLLAGFLFMCSLAENSRGRMEIQDVILTPSSNITLNCTSSGPVAWFYDKVANVHTDGNVLHIYNAASYHNREYICSANKTEILHFFIFVPDPNEWFRPQTQQEMFIMAEESVDVFIPCVATNPELQVTLYHVETETTIDTPYDRRQGFLGKFKGGTYKCRAKLGKKEQVSDEYVVETIQVSENLVVKLHALRTLVKKNELISVTCSANIELLEFSWSYPRAKDAVMRVTEGSQEVNSTLELEEATLGDTGWYNCSIKGYYPDQSEHKSLHITVLDKGFIELRTELSEVEYAELSEVKMFAVNITAYPAPTVRWLKNNVPFNERTNQVTFSNKSLGENRYQCTLNLIRVKEEDFGNYSIQVWNEDDKKELTFTLSVNVPARILDLSDYLHSNGLQTVTCITEGSPLPKITWYTCQNLKRCNSKDRKWIPLKGNSSSIWVEKHVPERRANQVYQVRSVLTQDSGSGIATVRCSANNGFGSVNREVKLVSNGPHSQLVTVATILVLLVIIIISLVVLMVIWRKKPRYEIRWKVIESVSSDGHEYIYVDPTQLPYDSSWEFPRSQLSLGRTLGSGAFGRVVEATAQGLSQSDSIMKVAVKMLKTTARTSEKQALMSELKIMSHLGPHLNIVNLLGACTKGGPIYIITEYCRHGDLVDYLYRNKHSFLQFHGEAARTPSTGTSDNMKFERMKSYVALSFDSDGGYMDMNKEDRLDYTPMLQARPPPAYAQIAHSDYDGPYLQENYTPTEQEVPELRPLVSDSPVLSFADLVGISYQVAHGMEFLSLRNCVHRDLAARNVLICEGKLAKICDFGLARDIVNDSNYISRGSTFLPLKWMAPESIFNNLYTTLSDVWSYAVLLWEIFTLGGTPYPELPVNDQFYNAIRSGYRMPKPHYATDEIYAIMKKCWNDEFEKRPSFSSLVTSMGNLLSESYKKRYAQVSQEFMKGDHPALRRTRTSTRGANDSVIYSNCLHLDGTDNGYIIPLPDPVTPEERADAGDPAEEPSSVPAAGTRPSSLVCGESQEPTNLCDLPQTTEDCRQLEMDTEAEGSQPEVEDSFL